MKNYKELWAAKARAKSTTREDMVERCLLRAMSAKTGDMEEIFRILLLKSFSPSKKHIRPYQAIVSAHYALNGTLKYRKNMLFSAEVLETNDEWDMFYNLINSPKALEGMFL